MRTLAIDYGTRRIGLAMSDEGGRFANPLEVLAVNDPSHAIPPILTLIKKESVERLVVGLPLNMDGTIGPAAREVTRFGALISEQIPIHLIYVDERLSSFDAEQQLNDRKRAGEKLTRAKKKQQLDAIVAANLLQQFLDGRISPIDVLSPEK